MLNVFVYGTFKPNEANFARFCQPYQPHLQPALTQGKLYRLPFGYPAMTLEAGWVEGFLLTFQDDRVLPALDELEDYQEGRSPEFNEYQRQKLVIYTPEKIFLTKAWGYVMNLTMVSQLGGTAINRVYWTGLPSVE